MFPLFPVSLKLFVRLSATWIWFHEIGLFRSFPCFSVSCFLLIDLEEFCFSQVGFHPPAVYVVPSRRAGTERQLPCMDRSELVASQNAGLVRSVWDRVRVKCFIMCMGLVLPATLNYRSWDPCWREIKLSCSKPHMSRASVVISKILVGFFPWSI